MSKKKKKLKKTALNKHKVESGIKWEILGPISAIFNILLIALSLILGQCYHEANQKLGHMSLAYNVSPKISIKYEYKTGDSSFFRLIYFGPSELEDFWVEEKVYLVKDTLVHECPDAPRLHYYHFDGSLRSMGTLAPGDNKIIRLSECWREFMYKLNSKFKGRLISRFLVRGTSLNSPEYSQDTFFEIDLQNNNYLPLTEVEGFENIRNTIFRYIGKGPKSEIIWESASRGYSLNPPKWYLQPVSIVGGKATYSKVSFPRTDPFSVTMNSKQSVKHMWFCDSITSVGFSIYEQESNDL